MVIETFDRPAPAFFRPGPSALAKLAFFSALALFLMVADARFALTEPLRAALATLLDPVERVVRVPIDAWHTARDYLNGLDRALAGEEAARRELARQAERALRVEQLELENTRLRGLLELRPTLAVRSFTAEVLYEAPDAYSRKVVVDRGASHGVVAGAPVINELGVLGQVTRVYPLASEVTLLTDKDAAIPVLNTRTQVRSAAFGRPGGAGMELRFMAGNADVQVGDLLTTSGVDGVYPPGLPVAKVASVDRRVDTSFARVGLQPVAAPDGVRHVLLLEPQSVQLAPRPGPAAEAAAAGVPPAAAKKGARK
jgi:rod shape-determining protein MreC